MHEMYEMFFIIGTSIVGLQWCQVFWRGLERNKNVVQQHKRIWQNKSRKIWTWIQVSFSHNRYDKYSVSLFQNETPAVILVKQSYNQLKSLDSIVMSMNTQIFLYGLIFESKFCIHKFNVLVKVLLLPLLIWQLPNSSKKFKSLLRNHFLKLSIVKQSSLFM